MYMRKTNILFPVNIGRLEQGFAAPSEQVVSNGVIVIPCLICVSTAIKSAVSLWQIFLA
jgi:hypothetical protein